MRPLQLSFSGMRSYAGSCGPLDFAGKSLVGILGDTGAGKSTILEAITFALYGNPSWSNRDVAPLKADGATSMSVDFTFAHDGDRWRVRRIFHANTTPTSHLLENLETGEKVDNGRAVNQRIVSLLNLNYDSFQAAVLLPQGRFDRLLTATGRERTDLLKGIFGTQMIETMHGQATEHRERLSDLLNEARLARGRLLENPAEAAAEAERAAEQAELRAAGLTEALNTLRNLQKAAITARGRRDELAGGLAELERRWVGAAAEIVGEVEPIERELIAEEIELATARETAGAQRVDAENRLADAAGEGQTPESLTSADILLSSVPQRLAELAEDRDRLRGEQLQLTDQNRELDAEASRLAGLRATAAALAEASEAAAATATKARDGLRLLRDASGTALAEAINFARARQEQRVAQQRLQPCRDALPPLHDAVDQAVVALRKAAEQLDEVGRGEAAHTLGAELSAGDDCPVCERPLPGDYRSPAAIDPQAMRFAERTKSACETRHQQALNALNRAETTLNSALDRYEQRQQAAEYARSRLDRACETASNMAETHVSPLTADGVPPLDQIGFAVALKSVVTSLADPESEDGERRRTDLLSGLLEPATAIEHGLTQAATAARDAAHASRIKADNADQVLKEKRAAHELAAQKSSEAERRHATAERNLERDLRTLRGIAAQNLPADILKVTAEHIAEARRIVAERRDELAELVRTRDQATGELASIAERQLELNRRRADKITRPLQSLVTELNRWAETLEEVAAVLDATHRSSPPLGPEDLTTTSVGRYAAALEQSGSAVRAAVYAASEDARTRADQLTDELTTRIAALRTGATGTGPAISLDDDVDLLDAAALDPVADAATTARNDAHRLRADQAEAKGQIERARTLDAAIKAGNARYVAVDKLRALLAEAKFPQYLTGKRTMSLLGLASDLFKDLSGGQFGFTADFQIVSVHSRASRSPKTLSGGETFLASLALALALVELYSRSGARLGALFLDEGFGSLDVDTLARALAVLRAETGGDKLVTVISHLHAVAEAVEDVLWVERRPTGSVARWLDVDERDALVREDVSAGLLSLA